jgi:hypothetical protein
MRTRRRRRYDQPVAKSTSQPVKDDSKVKSSKTKKPSQEPKS